MPDSPQHVTAFEVEVSLDPTVPTLLEDRRWSLAYAVASRESLKGLDGEWDTAGVYLLLGRVRPGSDMTEGPVNPFAGGPSGWVAYVGKTTGLRDRVRAHARNGSKDWFDTAVLVRRDDRRGLDDNLIAGLERRIFLLLDGWGGVHLGNGNTPPASTALTPSQSTMVEEMADGVLHALALVGYRRPGLLPGVAAADTEPPEATVPSSVQVSDPTSLERARRPNTVTRLLETGTIPDGTEFRVVVEGFRLADRDAVRTWLAGNQDRGLATWTSTSGDKALRWAANGATYTASGLLNEILLAAGCQPVPLRGPAMWADSQGRTLVDIASNPYA